MSTIKCFKCGECCHTLKDIKLSKQEYDYLCSLKSIKAIPLRGDYFLMQLPCPFQKKNGKCSIHKTRPTWCRMWHCGKIKKSDKILEFISEVQALMKSNPEYKKFRTEMEDSAVVYGNKHGWNWGRVNNVK